MVVPITQEAAQEIRPPEPRRIRGRGTTQGEVVAAAGAGMATVEHEFFRCETGFARRVVKERRSFGQFVPARRRMNVDLDYAGIGSDAKKLESRIARRLIAFKQNRLVHRFGGCFRGGNQLKVVLQRFDRGHEDIENAVSRLSAHGRTGDPRRAFMAVRHPIGFVALVYAAGTLGYRGAYGSCRVDLKVNLRVACQGRKLLRWIRREGNWVITQASPRLRIEGQPEAHGRISGNQIATIGAQKPTSAVPMSCAQIAHHLQRIASDTR